MASKIFVELVEGDTLALRYTVVDAKKQRVNLTGVSVFSSVWDESDQVVIAKSTPVASGIEIQDQNAAETEGQFIVFYASSDSVSKAGNHEIDTRLKFTVPTVRVATLVHESPFNIKPIRTAVP